MLTPLIAGVLLGQSGLKVKDITVGHGRAAQKGDTLTMLYKGTLASGKVFDENFKKAPFCFTLGAGEVIKGWDQGLNGIRLGGKRKLVIPPDLGYGENAVGPIPANSTLTFEVEVLRIDPAKAVQTVQITELKKGTGNPAKDGNTVKVHYKGTFLNGFMFDQSYGKAPLEVTLGQNMVVQGFEQGIRGLKVGGKRKVVIPFTLAYGAAGRPPVIPPKATLVFVIEMVSIK